MSQKYVEIWEASKSSRNVLNIGICWQLKVYTWIFLIGFGYLGVLNTGLEVGRIYHPEFLLLLWELGYRHKKTEDWQKDNSLTNTTKMRLYCLDKLFDNTLNIDLKEILTSSIIQAVCLIEDIRNNRITFTNHPNWKSRINSIRSASNHPLNNYWGYIDMALDNFHTKEGQSMRTYLCQKEPGIKLDNKEETIVKETNLYKALTILYPDIYN